MKKTVIVLIIVIVVIVGALVAIPTFFAKNLLEFTQNTLNNNLNAEVEFSDLKLSLFRNFPKTTVEINNVVIKGVNEFQDDTLLSVAVVRTKMDLASLFRKSDMSIEEIIVDQPILNLIVNETGKVNWDIAKNSEEPTTKDIDRASNDNNSFQLQLEKIDIHHAVMQYEDKQSKMLIILEDIDFNISGNMYGSGTQLETNGTVENFVVRYNDINYITNTSLSLTTMLDVNFDTKKYSIAENELLINRLPLELSGSMEMPSDSMLFDMQLKTKKSDFENFLALVPPAYEEYLKDIQTSGTATISGDFKGIYIGDNYPAFHLLMKISDGNFKYADLPEEVKNINAEVLVSKPQGELDLTEIKVKNAHAEIKNNPVDLTLNVLNPVSDPWFDGAFVGKVNFAHLKHALPIDSVNISGEIDANLFVKGNYSDVENEAYDQIESDGVVLLNNFVYDSPKLTRKVNISEGQLDFSPETIDLKAFSMRVGQSDFRLTGNVSNYLNYLLKDGTLDGNLKLNSSSVNINELLRLQVPEKKKIVENEADKEELNKDSEEEVLAFDIPENIDITFRSNIKSAIFDRVPISNIEGLITARNGKLMLNGLKMNMLDGQMKVKGSYQNTPQDHPLVDFGLDIVQFDIPVAYRSLTGIQKMLPVAGHSTGKFSSSINIKGQMNEYHKLIPASIDGNGLFSTRNLEVVNSPIFNQLKGILKSEKLKNVKIDDFKANFTVVKGNLLLKPFKTTIADQETHIAGSLNSKNLLDMKLDFNIQREAFGPDIQNILAVIPGNENIKVVPAGVNIKGPVGEPEVKMDLSETRKYITDATKDDIQKSLNKLGKGLKKLFEK